MRCSDCSDALEFAIPETSKLAEINDFESASDRPISLPRCVISTDLLNRLPLEILPKELKRLCRKVCSLMNLKFQFQVKYLMQLYAGIIIATVECQDTEYNHDIGYQVVIHELNAAKVSVVSDFACSMKLYYVQPAPFVVLWNGNHNGYSGSYELAYILIANFILNLVKPISRVQIPEPVAYHFQRIEKIISPIMSELRKLDRSWQFHHLLFAYEYGLYPFEGNS